MSNKIGNPNYDIYIRKEIEKKAISYVMDEENNKRS